VFAGLHSGDLAIFSRSQSGLWLTANAHLMKITKQSIIKLLAVCNRLWIAVGNELLIYQPSNMQLIVRFHIWIIFGTRKTNALLECAEHNQSVARLDQTHSMFGVEWPGSLVEHGSFVAGSLVSRTFHAIHYRSECSTSSQQSVNRSVLALAAH
jgi:hypothetical protein